MRRIFMTTLLMVLAPQTWGADTLARSYPTTVQTITRGNILSAGDITQADVGNLVLPKSTVMDESALVGMEVTRPLRAGMPISSNSLRLPPDAYKGKDVSIVITKPGLEITTKGKAMQDGYAGDSIRVFSSLNQKIINATVVSPGVVTLN